MPDTGIVIPMSFKRKCCQCKRLFEPETRTIFRCNSCKGLEAADEQQYITSYTGELPPSQGRVEDNVQQSAA